MARRKRPGGKANATGRNETPRFVQLFHWMLESSAYRELRPVARALLVELARRYNGINNGEIGLGEREAIYQLDMSDRKAIRRAFKELKDAGFIVKTRAAAFNVKTAGSRRASEWRLTWLPTSDASATRDFMRSSGDAPSAVSESKIGGVGFLSSTGRNTPP